MIHLTKKNGMFHVTYMAANHEVISQSQPKGLTTRKGAFKNVRSHMKSFRTPGDVLVQDDTVSPSIILAVNQNSITRTQARPNSVYVPGKTKSPGRVAKRPVKKAAKKK